MAEYYYTKGGERRGPIPEAELSSLIQSGDVVPSDYYWTQGMPDWKLVSDADFARAPAVETTSMGAESESADAVEATEASPFASPEPAASAPFGESSTAITPTADSPVPVSATASPATSEPTPTPSVFGTGTVISDAHSDTVFVKDVANALPKPLWLLLPGILAILVGIPYLIVFFLGAVYIWIGVLLIQANSGLENARRTGSSRELMSSLKKINTIFVIFGVMTLVSIVLVVLFFVFAIAAGNNF